MKSPANTQAVALRKTGLFYSEIARELGIAKSTARLWTKDVKLDTKEAKKLANKYSERQRITIEKMAANKRTRRLARDLEIQKAAAKVIAQAKLSTNHKKIICACLFWCEGAKNTAGGITFINSDPHMMQTFLKLLRESFNVDENRFRAIVHLHEYHDIPKQLHYWSQITQIPLEQFYKPYLKPHTGTNKREGYPGCVSVRYLDSALGKLLKMIYIEFSKAM